MNQKFNCGAWCWIAYALPCLLLLGWCATGHEPGDRACLLLWLYGFPSSALLLPVVSLIWELPGPAEFLVTAALAAVVNGGLLFFILRLIRDALQPETESARENFPETQS